MFSQMLANDSVFAGRYRIVRPIAQGGMGAVYEVLHTETERLCALKVMLPRAVPSEEMQRRFKLEARIASKIRSEYIVDVLDAGIDAGTGMPFLVMELLDGEELDRYLGRAGKLSFLETADILSQVAAALDKVHDANIIHRDLKPSNLFVCKREDGSRLIKLLDFGIAKTLAEGESSAWVTRSIGTPLFMAPEQFRTDAKISAHADIYAIGMLAFMCLTGSSYWSKNVKQNPNPYAVISIIMAGPCETASNRAGELGVSLPGGFDSWFAKATAFNPKERFAKASIAIESLRNLAESNSIEQMFPTIQVKPNPKTDKLNTNSIKLNTNPISTVSGTTLLMPSLQNGSHTRSKSLAAALVAAALCGLGTLTLIRAFAPAPISSPSGAEIGPREDFSALATEPAEPTQTEPASLRNAPAEQETKTEPESRRATLTSQNVPSKKRYPIPSPTIPARKTLSAAASLNTQAPAPPTLPPTRD